MTNDLQNNENLNTTQKNSNMENSAKISKQLVGILTIVSAVCCFLMLTVPIVCGKFWERDYFGYGIYGDFYYAFKQCTGFNSLIFDEISQELLYEWYAFVGIINWFIALIAVASIALSILSYVKFTDKQSRTISFIISIFCVISGFVYTIEGIVAAAIWGNGRFTLAFIPFIIQCALLGLLIYFSKQAPIIEEESEAKEGKYKGFYPLSNHILLMLFVPFWSIVWIYRITGYLNCVDGEEKRDPTNKLLLCLFVPFYTIYWNYKSAQIIDKFAKTRGVSSDLSTICLVLSIFIGIIPPILMQQKINEIETINYDEKNANNINTAKSVDMVDELKKFKELFDMGVITEEEYNNQKDKLLNKYNQNIN